MRVRDSNLRIDSFSDAAARLGGRDGMTLCNNTSLQRLSPTEIAVRLHGTYIVKYQDHGTVVLNTGGWATVTTKSRMNAVLPHSIRVYQRDHSWYVRKDGEDIPFCDGITLSL